MIYHKDTIEELHNQVFCVLFDTQITLMQVGRVIVVASSTYVNMRLVAGNRVYTREMEESEYGKVIGLEIVTQEARLFENNVILQESNNAKVDDKAR